MQKLIDPALRELEKKITSKLTPEQMKIYDGFVKAGMTLLYDPKTRQQGLAGLNKDKPELKAAIVAVGVVKIILDRAKWQQMDPLAMKVGGVGILINLLDFLVMIGVIQITPESLKRAVATVQALWKKGTTPPEIKPIDAPGQAPPGQPPQAPPQQTPAPQQGVAPAQGLIAGAMA